MILKNLRWIANQLTQTYNNHSQLLIPDGIHLIFWTRFWEEREARSILVCWAIGKGASGSKTVLFKQCLLYTVRCGQWLNLGPPAQGANALTPSHHCCCWFATSDDGFGVLLLLFFLCTFQCPIYIHFDTEQKF